MTNNSEEFRFQCEVRSLLRLGIVAQSGTIRAFLNNVEKKRGKPARDALEKAYREQWTLGNRGLAGTWLV